MKRSEKKVSYRKIVLVLAIFIISLSLIFVFVPRLLNKVVNKTTKISEYNLLAQNLLGTNGKKNILILFMNNAEQRFGGGFIGSIGYVSVDKGKISPSPVRGVYYYDWKFEEANYREVLNDPSPNEVLFTLRDSGQSLDWTKNAKRAKTIFERESGKDVDTVVGVTPEILKYLIRKTGPVKLDDYNLTITDSNITETIQQQVEYGNDKVEGRDPKTILTSLINVLMDRLAQKNVKDLSDLLVGMNDLMKSRQILVYNSDYEFSKVLEKYKLDGSLVKFSADYFLMSESNNSVDKSNAFIDRKLDRNIQIAEDGSVVVTTKIIRNQIIPVSFPYVDPHAPDVQTNLVRKNKSYIKMALPAGSKILEGEGYIKLDYKGKEDGYDIYGFESDLEPLEPSEYTFRYELPFKLAASPNFDLDSYLQIANGGWPYSLSQNVTTPKDWEFVASNRGDVKSSGNTTSLNTNINSDIFVRQTYKK